MILEVRLFAVLREQAGCESLQLELTDGATVADALESLAARGDRLAAALAAMPVVMAVNRSYASAEEPLSAGDELALIPPVSGGAAGPPHVRVHPGPLSADALTAAVSTPHSGAIVTFHGTTRDVERLEYEAYVPMATERIVAILEDAATRHEIEAAAAEHRVGAVPLGEASVIVAVAAAHRGPAFAAAREAIDRIKAEAPIWKREVEGDSAEWVAGAPPPSP